MEQVEYYRRLLSGYSKTHAVELEFIENSVGKNNRMATRKK